MSDPADALALEVDEIREEYRRRSTAGLGGAYSFLNPVHARLVLERELAILQALSRHLGRGLGEADVLDVGCGAGTSLAFLAAYGADPARLHGADTADDRIAAGRERFPAFGLRISDGMTLPFADASFDLVQQITMLSSVHSDGLRAAIVAEMLRVVRPGGLLLSYDAASVALAPRALNRLLGGGPKAGGASPAAGPAQPAVALRQIRPLDERDLRALFAAAEPLETIRLSAYRPLVERLERHPRVLAVLPRSFGTAVLHVARAPGPGT